MAFSEIESLLFTILVYGHYKYSNTVYDWNGFPCTNSDVKECCGGNGECIATSKGGYCKHDTGNFIYKRASGDTSRPYIQRSNDKLLDKMLDEFKLEKVNLTVQLPKEAKIIEPEEEVISNVEENK